MAKLSAQEIIDSLKEMTLLEIKEVVDLMKEEFGVDPSAVAVAAAPAAEAASEGPSAVDVVLASTISLSVSVFPSKNSSTSKPLKSTSLNIGNDISFICSPWFNSKYIILIIYIVIKF